MTTLTEASLTSRDSRKESQNLTRSVSIIMLDCRTKNKVKRSRLAEGILCKESILLAERILGLKVKNRDC